MKIVSLNLWGGRMRDQLMEFFKTYSAVDVFCLQEVYHEAHGKDTIWKEANLDSLNEVVRILNEHLSFYHPHLGDWWGLASFVRKNIELAEVGEKYVHLFKGHDIEREVWGHTAKNIQFIKTVYEGKPLTILNFHGLWNGQGKFDCEERLEQSRKIVEFLQTLEGEVILCGDFNLLPDTESIAMIENTGLRNLIKEYGITSTRTSFYKKPEKFADYFFVSKGITVKDFRVLEDEVSDHAPLYLEI